VLLPCFSERSARYLFRGNFPVEPYQRSFHIVKQTIPWSSRCSGSRDKYIVETRERMLRQKLARGDTQTAPSPVSDNSAANFSRSGKAFADVRLTVFTVSSLHHNEVTPSSTSFRRLKKFSTNLQPTNFNGFHL
tara:strand:+ start:27655 stop:28056 length:402 start_codon:yes stop_codon:yes gene_type:complete